MDERRDHLWKVAQEAEDRIEDLVRSGANPMGLDVGTSKIVAARKKGKDIETASELNAFIPVPYSRFTETILGQNNIQYYREGDELIIYGSATEKFANMFNADARRPMSKGVLNPREKFAMPVLEAILQNVIPKARTAGETMAFSVPAAPAGQEPDLTYHEATLRNYLDGLGYKSVAINEGLAVVFSELEEENFTGIGISCGGGMCNGTLAFLSIPSIMFSISKGGDFIDSSAGNVINEHATRVKVLKEESLDLSKAPKDKLDKALHIYYDKLIESLVEELSRAVTRSQRLPRSDQPLPIVLAGGTAKPNGFRERFEKALRRRTLPFQVADVRVASDPLTATARGALVAALAER